MPIIPTETLDAVATKASHYKDDQGLVPLSYRVTQSAMGRTGGHNENAES